MAPVSCQEKPKSLHWRPRPWITPWLPCPISSLFLSPVLSLFQLCWLPGWFSNPRAGSSSSRTASHKPRASGRTLHSAPSLRQPAPCLLAMKWYPLSLPENPFPLPRYHFCPSSNTDSPLDHLNPPQTLLLGNSKCMLSTQEFSRNTAMPSHLLSAWWLFCNKESCMVATPIT